MFYHLVTRWTIIDHITDNIRDMVGITETWLSNADKNNMPVFNTCLDSGYTLQKYW